MKSIEESVITAMDGTDVELYPLIPYILQDLWEIGSSPDIIIELVRKHSYNYSNLNILDLGCGKGIISIKLAKEFTCKCFGIDAVKDFIEEANKKAKEYGVDHLCKFEINDIRKRINELSRFDIIILGSIGPVFGDYYSTLINLSDHLRENGFIIIDDGYIEDNSDFSHPLMKKRKIVFQQIKDAGMELINEKFSDRDDIKVSNDYIFEMLKKRCNELIKKYPEKRKIFENYIKKQEKENHVLENKIICSAMVIKKK